MRDGSYPATWDSNLAASSVLYCAGGLLWNLDWRPGRGLLFAFLDEPWPDPAARAPFLRVAGFAAIFIALVAAMLLPFLWM